MEISRTNVSRFKYRLSSNTSVGWNRCRGRREIRPVENFQNDNRQIATCRIGDRFVSTASLPSRKAGKVDGEEENERAWPYLRCSQAIAVRSIRRDSRNKSLMRRFRVGTWPTAISNSSHRWNSIDWCQPVAKGFRGSYDVSATKGREKERIRDEEREREGVLILKITRRVRGPVERGLASIRISLACRVPGVAPFFLVFFRIFSFEFLDRITVEFFF